MARTLIVFRQIEDPSEDDLHRLYEVLPSAIEASPGILYVENMDVDTVREQLCDLNEVWTVFREIFLDHC